MRPKDAVDPNKQDGVFSKIYSANVASLCWRNREIHLHLRYQEVVTDKRVVSTVISIWVLSVSFSLLLLWIPLSISSTILGVISIVCFTATAFFNFKIYSTVKSLANQVQPLQNQQIVRLKKSAIGTFYIYLVFLLCYLPRILGFGISNISGSSSGSGARFSKR